MTSQPPHYSHCPKCGHQPLPADQRLPAACAHCGVILAKLGQLPRRAHPDTQADRTERRTPRPDPVDALHFWCRLALLAGLLAWSAMLIRLDYRSGDMGTSFIHLPLLVFHEAGHVLFMPLGPWMGVLGGTLMQLLMPALLAGALLLKNRDPFGAAVGLWFVGVSLLDVAPYMYDALHPQLMLLSGHTGEDGGHDWIYLFSSLGLRPQAPLIGRLTHQLGVLVVLLALGAAGWRLWRSSPRATADDAREDLD